MEDFVLDASCLCITVIWSIKLINVHIDLLITQTIYTYISSIWNRYIQLRKPSYHKLHTNYNATGHYCFCHIQVHGHMVTQLDESVDFESQLHHLTLNQEHLSTRHVTKTMMRVMKSYENMVEAQEHVSIGT